MNSTGVIKFKWLHKNCSCQRSRNIPPFIYKAYFSTKQYNQETEDQEFLLEATLNLYVCFAPWPWVNRMQQQWSKHPLELLSIWIIV